MTKYTEGPFGLELSTNDFEGHWISGPDRIIATTVTDYAIRLTAEDKANALLFAHSFTIKDALQRLVDELRGESLSDSAANALAHASKVCDGLDFELEMIPADEVECPVCYEMVAPSEMVVVGEDEEDAVCANCASRQGQEAGTGGIAMHQKNIERAERIAKIIDGYPDRPADPSEAVPEGITDEELYDTLSDCFHLQEFIIPGPKLVPVTADERTFFVADSIAELIRFALQNYVAERNGEERNGEERP